MRTFVGLYYGATGSSWLLNTLESSPELLIPAYEPLEWMHWPVGDTEKLAWLETVLDPPQQRDVAAIDAWKQSLATTPQYVEFDKTEFKVVGFKMSAAAMERPAGLLSIMKEKRSALLVMTRRNRLKHALSLYRTHDEDKHQFHGKGYLPPSEVNMRTFRKRLAQSDSDHRLATELAMAATRELGQDRVVRVDYEDFVHQQGKFETVGKLASFFGLDSSLMTPSGYKKATPDLLREAVANYHRFERKFRRTKYARYLDD